MLRRAALAAFASAALLVAACGHQVTPNPSSNNLAGSMLIRFRTAAPMNFAMYDYQIVIDACGGGTPYPNPNTTTYLDYTFSFNIGTSPFGVSSTFPILLQYIVTPGSSNQLNPITVRTSLSETTLTLNDNGQNNEFTLTFPRALLNMPLGPTSLPCRSSAVSPGPASPSPTPSGATAPSPTPMPTGTSSAETPNLAGTWKFNFFTIQTQGCPSGAQSCVLDSLGFGGPTDNSYNGAVINTTTTNATPINKITDTAPVNDPAAAIAGGEIDTYK